jgi:uncharacterized protein (DUF1330 family)
MIVIAELTDRERFLAGYARVVPPLVAEFGGRYVVRGSSGSFQVLLIDSPAWSPP